MSQSQGAELGAGEDCGDARAGFGAGVNDSVGEDCAAEDDEPEWRRGRCVLAGETAPAALMDMGTATPLGCVGAVGASRGVSSLRKADVEAERAGETERVCWRAWRSEDAIKVGTGREPVEAEDGVGWRDCDVTEASTSEARELRRIAEDTVADVSCCADAEAETRMRDEGTRKSMADGDGEGEAAAAEIRTYADADTSTEGPTVSEGALVYIGWVVIGDSDLSLPWRAELSMLLVASAWLLVAERATECDSVLDVNGTDDCMIMLL
jgi:hypothetical protein